MLLSAILNTRRPHRCLLLSNEEAARLAVEGWQPGQTVTFEDGPWTFEEGDRVTTTDVTEERIMAGLARLV